jgi:hypothetical protein
MRRLLGISVCIIIITAFSGCESRPSEKDLGTIIYEVPNVKGSDQPYVMPNFNKAILGEKEENTESK